MNKYNKHYLEKDPGSGMVLVEDGKPVLGKIAKSDCPLEERHVRVLNRSWKKTGIYLVPIPKETVQAKSDARLALEAEATELGIKFRDNIGDDKLQEKINKAIEE